MSGKVTGGQYTISILCFFSLKASNKIFDATNILFDANKIKCYNIS